MTTTTLSPTQQATDFIELVRATALKRGTNARGAVPSKNKKSHFTDITAQNIPLAKSFNETTQREALSKLFVNFDTLCRKNKIEYPECDRKEISFILANEYFTNIRFFARTPNPTAKTLSRLASLTIYNGTSFCSALDEEEFKNLRYPNGTDKEKDDYRDDFAPFYLAAMRRPRNPREFLREIIKKIETLKQDPNFANFLDRPHLFVNAAVYYPEYPEKILCDNSAEGAGLPYFTDVLTEEEELLIEISICAHGIDIADLPHDGFDFTQDPLDL